MNGRDLLVAVKRPSAGLCLPVGAPVMAMLRPVSAAPDDVARLTAWRNRHVRSFLTEFEATNERTARWISDVVLRRDNKILFMVEDLARRPFGYMGLDYIDWSANSGEADAIVRGETAVPGGMRAGLVALLDWARAALGLERLGVRVLADNPALEFYRKLGFVEERRVPLVAEPGPDGRAWVEAPSARSDRALVHMRLSP